MENNDKYQKPECYIPSNTPYPLCVGKSKEECENCCLYQGMDEKPYVD